MLQVVHDGTYNMIILDIIRILVMGYISIERVCDVTESLLRVVSRER